MPSVQRSDIDDVIQETFCTADNFNKPPIVWSFGFVVTTLLASILHFHFYRAMHVSAERGLGIACRPSVCNVGGL